MTLRERLLALLSEPTYSPATEPELRRRLGLHKKRRAELAHELHVLLSQGRAKRLGQERFGPADGRGRDAGQRGAERPGRHASAKQNRFATPPRSEATVVPEEIGEELSARRIFTPTARKLTPAATRAPAKPSPAPRGKTKAPVATRLPLGPDEYIGRIQFRAGGSAFVVLEATGGRPADPSQPPIQVFAEDTDVALPGDRVVVRVFAGRRGRRPGEKIGGVERVLERGRDTVVGDLRRRGRDYLVVPDDPRFVYEVAVSDPARSGVKPAPQPGDKVVVKLHAWNRRHDPLTGEIESRLGRTHEPQAELLAIFQKYNLVTTFPADVEREAATLPDRVHPRELAGRLDYREQPVFTIDPDDAKDFDDALSYEPLHGGDVRVGIHIADVSTYVRPGTALDREAQRRGNSTYLVGTVIPMLPEKLSNGLCSLVEGQDRLCKAVFLTFAKNGRLKETTFANTAIRSRKRLTYKQAYALMFEHDLDRIRALPLPPKHQTGSTGRALSALSDAELVDLQSWVRALWKIASRLRHDRMAHGSLDLDMPETKIFVDEQGYADRLEKIEHDESHQLIEEFMLAANEALARLTRTHSLPSLYRVHDEPDPDKLDEYRQLLATFDIHTGDLTRREELVKLIRTLSTHPQGYTLRTQLLRSLRKAAYRATADGHFGLNKKDYTHFTSPIRRYADLVVHRVFDFYLVKHQGGRPAHGHTSYNLGHVESLGEHLSLTEINSAEAERESVKVKLLEFFERELAKKKKTPFAAVVTDVRQNGFFVELVESMTFGFVPTHTLSDDHYVLNNAGTMFTGRRHKRRFAVNDRIEVVVEKVDRYKRLIDFRPKL
ncbi:ribonuclease R family protein [Opitutus terrae]|uniref:Ribonuclease R n=1 Tax=Opitutus terrae (strain DSM 11246 / JCM 15787 / PB90-1) TaxID=452637 RepID=B1ZUX4_OPITP|nr:RNB domain-containing ribonuclease [Opitutus terrae]ACB75944.1 VacB and RNase II family 3'-5' exoribonuclease [Opitutus terrae PB90-1]